MKTMLEELDNISKDSIAEVETLRKLYVEFTLELNRLLPESLDSTLAKIKLRESFFWASSALGLKIHDLETKSQSNKEELVKQAEGKE